MGGGGLEGGQGLGGMKREMMAFRCLGFLLGWGGGGGGGGGGLGVTISVIVGRVFAAKRVMSVGVRRSGPGVVAVGGGAGGRQ